MTDNLKKRLEALAPEKRAEFLEELRRKRLKRSQNHEPIQNPIQRHSYAGKAPASSEQKRFWFLKQFQPPDKRYMLPYVFTFAGKVDEKAMGEAGHSLISEHEIFRTVLVSDQGTLYQRILDEPQPEQWAFNDLQDNSNPRLEIQDELMTPTDMSKDPPLRLRLFQTGPDSYILMLLFHHYAIDQWTFPDVFQRLEELYLNALNSNNSATEEPALQFADYAIWESELLESQRFDTALNWWSHSLDGIPQEISWSIGTEPAPTEFRPAGNLSMDLDAETVRNLVALQRTMGLSPASLHAACTAAYLARVNDQNSFILGTPVSLRSRPELANMFGFLVNTMPVPATLDTKASFQDFLENFNRTWTSALSRSWVPLDQIVRATGATRKTGKAPLFDVLFMDTPGESEITSFAGIPIDKLDIGGEGTTYALNVWFQSNPQAVKVRFQYDKTQFEADTARVLFEGFAEFLKVIALNPEVAASSTNLLSPAIRVLLERRVVDPRESLLKRLRQKLPEGLLPQLVWVDELPRTPSGKVDRRALPEPQVAKVERTPPRTDTEKTLATIWSNHLGLAAVGVHENFFEIGGHSLLAVQILSQLSRLYERSFPIGILFTYSTIAELAHYIDSTLRLSAAQESNETVTRLQEGNNQSNPIVIVHEIGGTLFPYRHLLNHIDEDLPVFGLQANPLDIEDGPSTVESITAAYARDLRVHIPTKTCRLCGWSFGGVLCIELARALKSLGIEVTDVTLIDSYAPETQRAILRTVKSPDHYSFNNFVRHLYHSIGHSERSASQFLKQVSEDPELPLDSKLKALSQALNHLSGAKSLDLETITRLFVLHKRHIDAYLAYNPAPVDVDVNLVAATRGQEKQDSTRGWKEVVLGSLKIIEINANHIEVLQSSGVTRIAELFASTPTKN